MKSSAEIRKNFWNISGKNELISLFEVDNINYSVIEGKNVEIINNNISEPTNLLIKNEIEYYGTKYNVVAISMGELGSYTRVIASKFNAPFTFAVVNDNTAPGQIDIDTMKSLMNSDLINTDDLK